MRLYNFCIYFVIGNVFVYEKHDVIWNTKVLQSCLDISSGK